MRNNTLIRNEKTASLFLTVDDPNRTTLAQSFKPFKNRLKSLFFIYHKKTQFKEVGNSKIFRQKKKQYLLRFIPLQHSNTALSESSFQLHGQRQPYNAHAVRSATFFAIFSVFQVPLTSLGDLRKELSVHKQAIARRSRQNLRKTRSLRQFSSDLSFVPLTS